MRRGRHEWDRRTAPGIPSPGIICRLPRQHVAPLTPTPLGNVQPPPKVPSLLTPLPLPGRCCLRLWNARSRPGRSSSTSTSSGLGTRGSNGIQLRSPATQRPMLSILPSYLLTPPGSWHPPVYRPIFHLTIDHTYSPGEVVTHPCTRRAVMLGSRHPPLNWPSCHLPTSGGGARYVGFPWAPG